MPLTREQLIDLAEAWRDEGGGTKERALVWAERVAVDGSMHVDVARSTRGPVPAAAELGALLWLERGAAEDRLVDALDSSVVRARRVFTPFGVLDVTTETGLIIVALAPGVSAVDLQELSRATLKIAPTVEEVAPSR